MQTIGKIYVNLAPHGNPFDPSLLTALNPRNQESASNFLNTDSNTIDWCPNTPELKIIVRGVNVRAGLGFCFYA